jgi:hypothetical protein
LGRNPDSFAVNMFSHSLSLERNFVNFVLSTRFLKMMRKIALQFSTKKYSFPSTLTSHTLR